MGSSSSRKLDGRSSMRGQGVAVALAAGEHADALEDVVAGEQEAAEQGAEFDGWEPWVRRSPMIVEHAGVGVEGFVLILREVIGLRRCGRADVRRRWAVRCRPSSRMSVDLPAPLTPTRAMRSPRSMVKLTSAEDAACSP